MAAGSHFGCPKITLDHISGHFRSIRNFLDVRNSLLIAFLAISDRYGTFFLLTFLTKWLRRPFWPLTFDHISGQFRSIQIFFLNFYKMAAGAHFGCRKITFNHISGNFRSIRNFIFFKFLTKWLPSAILDVRNSLLMAFLAILDRYRICFLRPFWMSENHFRSHFWPFLIDRPIWMSEIHVWWHYFLAPPAEWQRSFSNADSSFVRRLASSVVNVSLKWLISQKWPDNFFSFLAWSFLRQVLMYCKNMDLITHPKGHFKRSNLAPFLLGGNFLKNCLITLSLFMQDASHGGY